MTSELEASQRESRLFSGEVYKLRAQCQESQEGLEALRRENKALAEEVRDLVEQLSTGGRGIHELEKALKRAEQDKMELQAMVDELQVSVEREVAKLALGQIELSNVRQEIERRVHEKEEEFESTK